MSTKPYKGFEPKWMLQRAPENSYRSIFRWGDPDFFKYPKESLYKYVKNAAISRTRSLCSIMTIWVLTP